MADAGKHWQERYGYSLLGAVLIYCCSAADVMEIRDTLSDEEVKELQGLGALVEQKWRRGQRGEDDPIAQAEQPEPFVLIEEVASPSQLEAPDMALGVKAWKANQAHRLLVASAADSSSRDINVLAS